MRKLLLLCIGALFFGNAFSQITEVGAIETDESVFYSFIPIFLDDGTMLYYEDVSCIEQDESWSRSFISDSKIKLYSADLSLYKTIDVPTPQYDPSDYWFMSISYVSDKLFDLDDGIEFLVETFVEGVDVNGEQYDMSTIQIFDEDGTELFKKDSVAFFPYDYEDGSLSIEIYNTPDGTKMKLKNYKGDKVTFYSLPGTLKMACCCDNAAQTETKTYTITQESLLKAYPNPSESEITIEYKLPSNLEYANLLISDLNGRRIARKTCTGNSGTFTLHANELSKGAYYFKIESAGKTWDQGKLIVK